MPLLDHFHPPLHPRRHWESLHASWSNSIMAQLNERILPEGYYAETQIHIGGRVEVDVATLRDAEGGTAARNGPSATVLAKAWAPPAPPLVLSSIFPDEIEVQVISTVGGGGAYLVGAIELLAGNSRPGSESARDAPRPSRWSIRAHRSGNDLSGGLPAE